MRVGVTRQACTTDPRGRYLQGIGLEVVEPSVHTAVDVLVCSALSGGAGDDVYSDLAESDDLVVAGECAYERRIVRRREETGGLTRAMRHTKLRLTGRSLYDR